MTQDDINKAFEGRWRMKCYVLENIDCKAAKEIARDFFEAGIILTRETPPTIVEADMPSKCLVRESDILTVDDTFNKWWTLYDKKRGREKCLIKWKRMTGEEQFACIAATPAYVESTPDKTYRKDPLTYLNGKCWNDEIIMKNGTTDKSNADREKLANILAP